MKLVIVESPAKAKTIEKFLGSEYKVVASFGHIRDLPGSAAEIPAAIKDKPWARLAVDTENNFTPYYVITRDSKKHVTELKKLLKDADELILATDEDREGESISWHLLETLKPKVPVKRIAFHEITKSAIQHAITHPRPMDVQLVHSQEGRRILDRLYGYSLSPVLWKKIRTKLSAGRVQSVAVRLVVEREEERQAFNSARYWDIEAQMRHGELNFPATLQSINARRLATGKDFDSTTGKLKDSVKSIILDEDQAKSLSEASYKAVPWKVDNIQVKDTRQRPYAPFITSTLQQAASSNLGMSPKQTMAVAQKLYEGVDLGAGDREGLITYMRTDSLTLSSKALKECGAFIEKKYGAEYYTGPRVYKTKSKSAQEAHEAIRPTDVMRTPASVAKYLDKQAYSLYQLIWKRTLASQMADAVLGKTSADFVVDVNGKKHTFRSNGSVIKFPGHLKVYGENNKDTVLPELKVGQLIGNQEKAGETWLAGTKPLKHETHPPPRYTEASLIKKLEDEGIGRPSTYAPTISTIQQREYVVKKSGVLIPQYIGMAVVHLLRNHFSQYVNLGFTARMEEHLDEIASGSADWVEFLAGFYHGKSVNGKNSEVTTGLIKHIEAEDSKIEFPVILLGNDPESGLPINVKIGRTTAYLQRGEGGEGNTATIPVDMMIDELDVNAALTLLSQRSKAKESLGKDPQTNLDVFALIGPFGPYVQLGEAEKGKKPKRTSLPKGKTLEEVDLEYALNLLSLPRTIGVDPDSSKKVNVGLGRFGPYIEIDRKFKSLKSGEKLFTLELEEALEIFKATPVKTKEVLKELGKHPESEKDIQVLNGRYGPYITDGKVNAKMPKDMEPTDMTLELALPLLEEAAAKPKTTRGRKPAKKAAAKKTTKTAAKKTTSAKKATTAKKTTKKATGASKAK